MENNLKCYICKREFKNWLALGTHIAISHKNITRENYYKLFIDTESTGLCKICSEPTTFLTLSKGYNITCNKCCHIKTEESFILRFGEKEGKERFILMKETATKSNSLEGYKTKYGIEDGILRWIEKVEKSKPTKENFIRIYGTEEGLIKFNEMQNKKRISNSREGLIERHGKENAEIIFKKLSVNLNTFIEKFGEAEGILKYKEFKHSQGKAKRIEYFIERGYSLEEATNLLSESQSTFSLKKCINTHGEKEGRKVWKERQIKWQNTMKDKPIEEIERINRNKSPNKLTKYNVSKLEIEIAKILQCDTQIEVDGYKFDLGYMNKLIEVNGDYWYCNPEIYKADYWHKRNHCTAEYKWNSDLKKIAFAKKMGYDVLIIWESEYKKDKEIVIKRCQEFLHGKDKNQDTRFI